jgi:hypothetical protein
MDDLMRTIMDERTRWGPPDRVLDHQLPDLAADYAARVIALVLERIGGNAQFSQQELDDVPNRLLLLVRSTGDGVELETRRLAQQPG